MVSRGLKFLVFISAVTTLMACSPVKFGQNTDSATAQGGVPTGVGTPVSPSPNPSPVGPNPSPKPSPIVVLNPLINAIAFEDQYSSPAGTSDFDYNDFVANFRIKEYTNSSNQITDIYIDFYPRAAGAGYDHELLLVLTGTKTTTSKNSAALPKTPPLFNGSAVVTLTYYDQNGNVYGTPSSPSYNQDIVVFPSTHAVFGAQGTCGASTPGLNCANINTKTSASYIEALFNARVHIAISPSSLALNPAPSSGAIDPLTFRPILHPISDNVDIDIISSYAVGGKPYNFDGTTGYPWGFIIPTDWQWMTESVKIDNGYPDFVYYRDFLLGQTPSFSDFMNWANYPINPAPSSVLYPKVPFTQTMPALP